MSENREGLPRIPFSLDELQGIAGLVHGHLAYMRSLPAKPEREESIEILSHLHTKLEEQLATPGVITLPLTSEEIEHLLLTFVIFLRRLPGAVPQSSRRERAARQVNVWLLRLMSILTEFRTE